MPRASEQSAQVRVPVLIEIGFHARWTWSEPFVRFRDFLAADGAAAGYGRALIAALRREVSRLPDGGAALFVSHGDAVELGLVAALPDEDCSGWGPPFAHCEGARLSLEADRFR